MGEVTYLFGEIGEKNDLIKALNRYNYKVAAQRVAKMTDAEYRELVPKLNRAIGAEDLQFSSIMQSVNEAISSLSEEYGKLDVVLALLQIADTYAGKLKGGMPGLQSATDNTDIARRLRETAKLKVTAEYLEAEVDDGDNNKTRQ